MGLGNLVTINIHDMLQLYREVGTPAAMFITFIESFLPFLPLTGFVVLNTAAYGLIKGFLFSWMGSILGCWCLYWIIRYCGKIKAVQRVTARPVFQSISEKFNKNGMIYTSTFFFLPVFPNFIVTIVAALNKMDFKKFAISSSVGIAGLIFMTSYGVSSVMTIFTHPVKLFVFIAMLIAYYLFSKRIQAK
ncbi:MAG: TVP38/TMEM64 family protein [Bacillaceae bacterium]